ncbi:unnamed protein product [Didymodactylos carnosus]|uniref:Uncharacterized protein n=1 Tax=Didymodactylos carnosus TaxID=1234261 RepID=A0A8S2MZD0_9BILA|nr:unnamed protein product [Didymodactylos carnosus]CAF3982119.1 unnamed protein product [Didymodactylos carnosus]
MPHHQTLTIGQTVSVPSSVTLNSSNEYQQRNSLITNSIHSIVQNSNNTSYSQIISRQIMNSNEPTPSDSGITTSSASPPLQRCHTPIRPQPCSSASSISSQSSTFSSSSSNSSHVDIQYQSSHINVQSQIQTNKVRPLRSIAEQQQQPTTYYNGIVSQANSTTTIIGHPQLPPPPFTSKMPASANQQQAIAPKAPPAPISTPIVTTTSTVTTGSQQRLIAPITSSSQTDKSIPSTRPPLISLPPFIIPLATSDDCYFVRYDRDVNSYDGMKFSYLIDDLTSYNKHKRTIRYVSLNDL